MAERPPIDPAINSVSRSIVDAAFKVHSTLGPGLIESVYESCLARELMKRGCAVARQVELPVMYDGERIDAGLRIDMIVDQKVIVELKAVERMIDVYDAQLLTYLKLSGLRLGLLINFNVPIIKNGIKRIIL